MKLAGYKIYRRTQVSGDIKYIRGHEVSGDIKYIRGHEVSGIKNIYEAKT